MEHMKGLMLECERMWLSRVSFRPKDFSHRWHVNGFRAEWTTLRARKNIRISAKHEFLRKKRNFRTGSTIKRITP
jgi:hypothetical protein